MLRAFLKSIETNKYFTKDDKVVLAISGGKDSITLFHLLLKFFGEKKENLILYHLNHNLRGRDSERDQLFIEDLAEKHGLISYIESVDVKKEAQDKKLSVEEAGRLIRKKSLEELSSKHQAFICLAHNKDDLAETVLMRIIRGTGIEGLKGIKDRDGKIIRPLLGFSRKDIENYVDQNKLSFVQDDTNFENIYTRNKLRNMLIPLIEDEFNPNFKESLVNLSENATMAMKIIDDYTNNIVDKVVIGSDFNVKTLDSKVLSAIEISVFNELMRSLIKEFNGSTYGFTKKHLEEFYKIMQSEENSIKCIKGVCLVKNQYKLHIYSEDANDLDTEMILSDGHYIINNFEIKFKQENLDKIFKIRKRSTGDRVFINGKPRKLKDFFNDKKIGPVYRDFIPIVEFDGNIISVGDIYLNKDILEKENISLIIKKADKFKGVNNV